MIPYGRHDINEDDIAAVVAVLKSDFLTQGPQVPAFESAVAQKVGAAHAVAVNSATSALHIACLALGLGPGERLWTSPITFVASANCALYCGASVDFVDIDPNTFNMDPVALEAKLIAAKAAGTLPKVVVPVALCGQSADLKAIRVLADRFGFFILEDASHGIGARYDGHYIGDGRYADITVFSFHPVKIISTAEGGMATTNDPVLARRMQILRSHGITREQHEMTHESDGAWYYQQVDLGYNYRMTELQAALGISQMSRLDEFVSARVDRARSYDQALADLALRLPYQAPMTASSWHLYVIQLADAARHRVVFDALRADGIGVNLHYIPVHLQPYYLAKGFTKGDFPMAEDYYARSISIPLFSHMTDAQLQAVVDAVKKHVGV
jgi:UDP-4-amino-4,6-dideoxy-N-acetyl-beta-L-altrosamine transaminase